MGVLTFTWSASAQPTLKVDVNGGNPVTDLRPTMSGWQGWTAINTAGNTEVPTTNLPNNTWGADPENPFPFVTSPAYVLAKNFTADAPVADVDLSVTLSLWSLGNGVGGTGMNSRDRGGNPPNNDLVRDLVFVPGNGSNTQGTNAIAVQFSGLVPNTAFEALIWVYDSTGGHTMSYTNVAPPSANGYDFSNLPMRKSVTWTSAAIVPPLKVGVMSDGSGVATVWGWGGSGVSGDPNADTTYLNAIELRLPEPASLGLLAIGMGLLAVRRR
jgi:hypothetical protein